MKRETVTSSVSSSPPNPRPLVWSVSESRNPWVEGGWVEGYVWIQMTSVLIPASLPAVEEVCLDMMFN